MKYAINNSAPLNLSIGQSQYLYGTNDWVSIQDSREQAVLLSDCIRVFKHPDAKVMTSDGRKLDYWVSRKMVIPVNKENCLKSGIVSEKFAEMIPDSIVLEIPKGKSALTKQELFMLDLLSNYQWDRQINLLNQGGDLNIGLKDYLMYDGFSYRLVPFKNRISNLDIGLVDTDDLYHKMTDVYSFDAISRDDYFIDYQNMYTFLGVMSLRNLFVSCAHAFIKAGESDREQEMLDRCQEVMKPERFPLDNSILGWGANALYPIEMVKDYYILGKTDQARALAMQVQDSVKESIGLYLDFCPEYKDEFEYCCQLIYYMSGEIKKCGDKEFSDAIEADLADFLSQNS